MLQRLCIIGFASVALGIGGCGQIYRIDIQQGNMITAEMLEKLELGMSKDKVLFVMGPPMLSDFFHRERWDYFYTLRQEGKEVERKHVSLFFEQDRLARVAGDTEFNLRPAQPGEQPQEIPLL
jgi:outer membrane protein assembly factor BamE